MPPPDRGSLSVRWHVQPDAAGVADAAAQLIATAAAAAIEARGVFRVVLAGGSTPALVYRALRDLDTPWPAWRVYFGDERCLPPEHGDRNSRMTGTAWLDSVPIPAGNVHPIPAELGPEQGAAAYSRVLQEVDDFDLVLLGLGEDGHTASLFPGHDWGKAPGSPGALPVHDAPKPPPERVSLSAERLSRARQVLFLVTGTGKREAVAAWRGGAPIPAAAIAPASGVDVLVDAASLPDSPARDS
jgi:6-phosphogluconolactonase